MANVYVTVPSVGWIHLEVVAKLFGLIQQKEHRIYLELPCAKPIENNRDYCVRQFLKGDYDYWLTIDSDNPPLKNPLDLIEFDKDVIAYPTLIWDHNGHRLFWNIFDYNEETDFFDSKLLEDGFNECDGGGSGCLLIARRVMEKLMNDGVGPFLRNFESNGKQKRGSDLEFCLKVKKAGFKIWYHREYICDHFKECSLNTMQYLINKEVEEEREKWEKKIEELKDRGIIEFGMEHDEEYKRVLCS